jgi:putative ABC transport system ATP-binding protein
MEIMQRLNQETGTAFVFATHDPRVVAFARRVVKMRDGRLVGDDANNKVLMPADMIGPTSMAPET